ncbi:hypothetical protein F4677DRAFT_440702 [Hypoxylon crocopeplum]|nr:hypothetical protein F4677DRAFT_440702 [Hypoxylon crocopeplum]
MEEATKTIDTLVKNILPFKAHYLSLDTTRRYRPHVDDKRLEEQDIRPLQYTTFVSDAERGILLTRAYFDVREEPANPINATDTPTPRNNDPNKPKTKLSLKDYKNRKRSPDGEEPPKSATQPTKVNAPLKLPDPPAKEMDNRRNVKREIPDTKPDLKSEARRNHSSSPEKKRRIAEPEQDVKPVKRNKLENATPNPASSRLVKDSTSQKTERQASSEKKQLKDLKAPPTTNGKPTLNSAASKGASPRPGAQVNGSHKVNKTKDGADKKTESNSNSKTNYPPNHVPPLLSPIDILDYVDDDSRVPRPSPKKKPADSNNLKPTLKKGRDEREPSPASRKRKIPPLLSPTLPPIVLEELAKANKSGSSKDTSQRSSQNSGSPNGQKKATKSAKREETIHVDSNKGQRESLVVTVKYKKKYGKSIERLLALPPASSSRKKGDLLKKDDRANRDRSDSLEPGTARKRPVPAADTSEPSKRPKTSETLRPSTPPRQSSAMTRVASNSSQAGTPGVVNGTPAAQPPERRRPPVDQEKLLKLQTRAANYIQLGTKLKHERDAVLKKPTEGVAERDRQIAIAAGIQCLVSFLLGFKLQSDASDLERKPSSTRALRELLMLFRVSRADCARHNPLTALVLRLQGICLVHIGRIMWAYPPDPEFSKDILANCKEQQDTWRLADSARKAMGVYDGHTKSEDGGSVGKLIDRLGPWTIPEEAIPVTLEILRKLMQANGQWKPAEALSKVGPSITNGVT